MSKENKTTDFGFTEVPWEEKQKKVAGVFHSVAAKYDLMNDLMSFGIHRIWKKQTIAKTGVRKGDKVLDLAGGTGDLAYKFCQMVGSQGKVVLSDINSSMLEVGKEKLTNKGCVGNIEYVQANAECPPFSDNYFDCITISFGLRNVTNKAKALASMCRVLKPGGKLLVLEFSKPIVPMLSKVYDEYSFKALPFLGKIITQDAESYKYLAESIRKHPDQETLKQMMYDAGFDNVEYQNMTGGIVALHIGYKY
ncbi:bifunctional demethylmenaquinone methyltransferase/2-methoxy-6-polyprenyl-1,4-benzoquinol methylase UbiE [Francisella noatunensis]|uniref:Ubiquinone/menaquinone biosynthesis C-methyltransferase UbiE n=1 Tax=Francisella noatunensis TaxID=657445 RepID=A0A9Q2KWI1_9GAMM|nr:bifunctional demethylmenaquinone methyltransferase/2-methoxy-6-polyprenyl-1,4-benzoquinol methylase UbiE [Francisella noatunensis]MBK2029422.1 bifunctional demethylmenaquinone methyltransferase/2-methoxy-6-polyprenyl-1,4-benzoquinol methylase UbiE [Francisella noatunensis]MBK2034020.1 bifunctional demethylmenaquinone methyltransferase/2-methoxy-6-polyprenyl-1,4-benzoquinol methylase UbiE [Francisella noatunensis]MBK2049388.1 bifunctional demethylmenaquinone methyltransferase/2-methoxy-6-polyp